MGNNHTKNMTPKVRNRNLPKLQEPSNLLRPALQHHQSYDRGIDLQNRVVQFEQELVNAKGKHTSSNTPMKISQKYQEFPEADSKIVQLQEAMKILTASVKNAIDKVNHQYTQMDGRVNQVELQETTHQKEISYLIQTMQQGGMGGGQAMDIDIRAQIANEIGKRDFVIQELNEQVQELQQRLIHNEQGFYTKLQEYKDDVLNNFVQDRKEWAKFDQNRDQKVSQEQEQMHDVLRNLERSLQKETQLRLKAQQEYKQMVDSRFQFVQEFIRKGEGDISDRERQLVSMVQEGLTTMHDLIHKGKESQSAQLEHLQQWVNDSIQELGLSIKTVQETLYSRLVHIEGVVMHENNLRNDQHKFTQDRLVEIANRHDQSVTLLGNQLKNQESQLKALVYKLQQEMDAKFEMHNEMMGKWQDGSSGEMQDLSAMIAKLQSNYSGLNKKYDDIINQMNYQVLENQNKLFREYDSSNKKLQQKIQALEQRIGKSDGEVYNTIQLKFEGLKQQLGSEINLDTKNEIRDLRKKLRDLEERLQEGIVQTLNSQRSSIQNTPAMARRDNEEFMEALKQSEANTMKELGRNNAELQEQLDRLKKEVRKNQDSDEERGRNLLTDLNGHKADMEYRIRMLELQGKAPSRDPEPVTVRQDRQDTYQKGEIMQKFDDIWREIRLVKELIDELEAKLKKSGKTLQDSFTQEDDMLKEKLDKLNRRLQELEDRPQPATIIAPLENPSNPSNPPQTIIKEQLKDPRVDDLNQRVETLEDSLRRMKKSQESQQEAINEDNDRIRDRVEKLNRRIVELEERPVPTVSPRPPEGSGLQALVLEPPKEARKDDLLDRVEAVEDALRRLRREQPQGAELPSGLIERIETLERVKPDKKIPDEDLKDRVELLERLVEALRQREVQSPTHKPVVDNSLQEKLEALEREVKDLDRRLRHMQPVIQEVPAVQQDPAQPQATPPSDLEERLKAWSTRTILNYLDEKIRDETQERIQADKAIQQSLTQHVEQEDIHQPAKSDIFDQEVETYNTRKLFKKQIAETKEELEEHIEVIDYKYEAALCLDRIFEAIDEQERKAQQARNNSNMQKLFNNMKILYGNMEKLDKTTSKNLDDVREYFKASVAEHIKNMFGKNELPKPEN